MKHTIYLCLGTNMGDRLANLRAACSALQAHVELQRFSPIYETEPWGYLDQPDFLNQVLKGGTDLEPAALLDFLKTIENNMGRQPTFRNGPRPMDIDILFYDNLIMSEGKLTLPHPRIEERAFVLVPLADIAPDFVHPSLEKSISELLDQVDSSGIRLFSTDAALPLPVVSVQKNDPAPNDPKVNPYKNPPIGSGLKERVLEVAGKRFEWGSRTYVMGILNVTSDSFSGDGLVSAGSAIQDVIAVALEQARRFVDAGIDILDVGGESTRPGSKPLEADLEIERVMPVVAKLAAELDVVISIDTYKAEVAQAALNSGAHIVNDVWGLRADTRMAEIIAEAKAPVIIMHNRSSWAHAEIIEKLGGRYIGMEYQDLLADVRFELGESVELARSAGIPDERIILDPGIGFGKTVEQNLELIDRLHEIRSLGYPVLLGASRKSFIGYTLNLPTADRFEGSAAANVVGIVRGADIVRVHDVSGMIRLVRMTDAIVRRAG